MTLNIEIICVGNELLIGKILNTNAQWLAKRATAVGVAVKRITVVADVVEETASVVREALQRKPQFVITTGGLGPTFDDKTLESIAAALNRKLEVNPKALQMVKAMCEAYARKHGTGTVELTPPRVKMATIPEKTEPIHNPVGTAPAVRADVDGTVLFVLPGVPSEMEAIFEETILPLLEQASGGSSFYEKSLYVDTLMESNLAPLIDKVMRDNLGVYIKSHPMGNEIHFSIKSKAVEKPEEKLRKAAAQLAALIEKGGGKIVGST